MNDPLTIATEHNYFKPHIALFGAFSLRAFRESGFGLDHPVLDIGCGDGLFGSMLTQLIDPSAKLTGIDYSVRALTRAGRRNESCYTDLLRGDAQSLPFDDATYQTAFATGVLAGIPMTRSAISEAWRVLKPGGEFCCTVRTARFRESHLVTRLLHRFGLDLAAEAHSKRIDRRTGAVHVHFSPEQWVDHLSSGGFRVTHVIGLFPVSLMGAWGIMSWLPFRAASAVLRLLPGDRVHRLAARLVRLLINPMYRRIPTNLRPDVCASILIRARKDAAV